MSTAIAVWWVIFTIAGIVSFGGLLLLATRYRKEVVPRSDHRFCLGTTGSGMSASVFRSLKQTHGDSIVVYDNKCTEYPKTEK